MLIQALLLQLILPLALLLWLAVNRERARISWLLKIMTVIALLVSLHLGALWVIIPLYVSWLYLAAAVLFVIRSGSRLRGKPWFPSSRNTSFILWNGALFVAAVTTTTFTIYLLLGRVPQHGERVNLTFPLRQGTYYTANGGSNIILNPHMKTLADNPGFLPWRGQSYGIDLLKVNAWGNV